MRFTPGKYIRSYQGLQILNAYNLEILSKYMWPSAQNIILLCHVCINVILVLTHKSLPWGIFGMMLAGFIMISLFEHNCIKKNAQLYEESKRLIEIVSITKNCRQMKVAKSLQPLKVYMGSFYFFKMRTFMTYLATVVDYTITVLVTIRFYRPARR